MDETTVEQPTAEEPAAGVTDVAFWAAFHRVPYIGPTRVDRLLRRFPTLHAAWGADAVHLRAVLDERAVTSLLETRRQLDPEAELAGYRRRGIDVIPRIDARYPTALAQIPGAPPVLYVRGELRPEDDRAVAIVGTRRASTYAREVTRQFATELATAGVTVVSGLARGIDGVAHEAALQAGGRTIAVLGSGPDVIYPTEHRRLVEAILADRGAVLSDYPPGRKPDARNFPARNRIISGLSRGVVIVEAPARSGALITAEFAADQGREVFVVPSGVLAPTNAGGHALLRDGARIVTSAAELLEDLRFAPGTGPLAVQAPLAFDSPVERRLHALLTAEAQHIDDLAAMAPAAIGEVAVALQMMELRGQVRNVGAHHYVRA